MPNQANAETGCLVVGEYVDEGESPMGHSAQRGEAIRPTIVPAYLETWATDYPLKEFTVLLKDGRVVAVRGHDLKHLPHPVAGQDVYDVIVRNGQGEVSVALFKSADVAGIFHGELRADRKIA
jgi:hypothetical protein